MGVSRRRRRCAAADCRRPLDRDHAGTDPSDQRRDPNLGLRAQPRHGRRSRPRDRLQPAARLALPGGARPARSRDRGAARDPPDGRAHGRLQRGHGRGRLRVAARVSARLSPLDGPGRVDHRATRRPRRAHSAAGTLCSARHERERARAGRLAARGRAGCASRRAGRLVPVRPLGDAPSAPDRDHERHGADRARPALPERAVHRSRRERASAECARAGRRGCVAAPLPARRRLPDPHRRHRLRPCTDTRGDSPPAGNRRRPAAAAARRTPLGDRGCPARLRDERVGEDARAQDSAPAERCGLGSHRVVSRHGREPRTPPARGARPARPLHVRPALRRDAVARAAAEGAADERPRALGCLRPARADLPGRQARGPPELPQPGRPPGTDAACAPALRSPSGSPPTTRSSCSRGSRRHTTPASRIERRLRSGSSGPGGSSPRRPCSSVSPSARSRRRRS